MTVEHDHQPGETLFQRFSRTFWMLNALELFERGAYYGTMAILAVHLHDNLGYSPAETGFYFSVLLSLLYFIPLVAAALAEKYGYKRVLYISFFFMIAGYLLFGAVEDYALIWMSILLLGIGAGTFKPMISAGIAHLTAEEHRNQAYAIYYWMINLGALAVPWTFAAIKGANIFDPVENSHMVFTASAGLISVNILIAMRMKDPRPANPDKDIFGSLKTMVTVLGDRSFSILLLIYSGFWFMFAMNHTFLPLYMVHFLEMPDWFSVFLLAGFNPLTIVVAGPFLSKMVKKRDPLKLMIIGISIFCAGIIILGFSTSPSLFLLGIIIFSLGEFITHPNFISYVSKIAPKDKVAIYMGYVFIPAGIGYTTGSFIGGLLFGDVAEHWERPKLFWAIVACAGFATIFGFVMYDKYFAKKDVEALTDDEVLAMASDEEPAPAVGDAVPPVEMAVEGVDEDAGGEIVDLDAEPAPAGDPAQEAPEAPAEPEVVVGKPKRAPPFAIRSMSMDSVAMFALIMIPVVLIAAFTGGTNAYIEDEDDDDGKGGKQVWTGPFDGFQTASGMLTEPNSAEYNDLINRTHYVMNARFVLTWDDEPNQLGMQNDGDTFNLTVESPDGIIMSDTVKNENNQQGEIELIFDGGGSMWRGDWNITVTLEEAGEQWLLGQQVVGLTDDSNDYDLDVEWEYMKLE